MTDTGDHALAFVAAAFAPAAATGLVILAGSLSAPGEAGFGAAHLILACLGFVLALLIAGLHVAALAVPLHLWLSRRGSPGPGRVLAAAALIGALPIPLLVQGGIGEMLVFGLAGLIGGVAFLLVSSHDAPQGGEG
ncbi:MAG TPA: hypothetical protein VMG08_11950 [Allosphingosinicella sp.]|nr:hypothetical protein [Allosphingosinicella sp.]